MKTAIAIAVLLVAGALIVWFQFQAQQQLRDENRSLQQSIAGLTAANTELSNRLAAAADANKLSEEQQNELLRLRAEGARWRQQTQPSTHQNEPHPAPSVPAAIDSNHEVVPDVLPRDISKDALTFSGYATPADALQSFYWAASHGNVKMFFASVTPETNIKIIDSFRSEGDVNDSAWLKARLLDEFGGLETLHVSDESIISDNQILVNYDGERPGQTVTMIKIGDEWRFSLPNQ